MATPNDNPAGSFVLPIGPYWGVAEGTTIGADIDTEVFIGWDARLAWYHWPSLPAGDVYVFVRPDTTVPYLEAALIPGLPTDITEDTTWIGYGDYDPPPGSQHHCMLQALHTGGPLTLAILMYDPDVCDFTLGWGHSLDADPTHWDTTLRSNPWWVTHPDLWQAVTNGDKAGNYTFRTSTTDSTIPADPDGLACAFGNARRGVVGSGPPCVSLPNGAGSDDEGAASHVGQGIEINTWGSDLAGGWYRDDTCTVKEAVYAVDISPTSFLRAPLDGDDQPGTWSATKAEFDQWATGLCWGWKYTRPRVEVGPIGIKMLMRSGVNGGAADDLFDRCTPVARYVPPSMIAGGAVGTPEPNKVWTRTQFTFETTLSATFLSFDALGPELFRYEGPSPGYGNYIEGTGLIPATWQDLFQPNSDGSTGRLLVWCFVAAEALSEQIPSNVPINGDSHDTLASCTLGWLGNDVDWRYPDYQVYLGFPLVPPAPTIGAWHIGRVASGAW
jgi:hypothetical protein